MRVVFALMLCLGLLPSRAHAEDIRDALSVVWESFWQQTGYPRYVYKWQAPIRVKFTGASVQRHSAFTMQQLKQVADIAGMPITQVAVDDATANVEVEFVSTSDPLPDKQPCVTNTIARNGVIQRARIRANELTVWRCMLHESMHLMGIPGHPMGNSILTYFARSGGLTEIDTLLLRMIYSEEVQPGMSRFAVLPILARHIVEGSRDRPRASLTATSFLRTTVQQMEQFGNGTGEPPAVVLRSSKATGPGLARGQIAVQYFLGLAYLNGDIVDSDKTKAMEWLAKAAARSHSAARILLEEIAAQEAADTR